MEKKPAWEYFTQDDSVHDALADICAVLYEYGITEIPVGGLMRVLGIDNDTAAEYDDEIMVLDGDFENFEFVDQLDESETQVPAGVTIH